MIDLQLMIDKNIAFSEICFEMARNHYLLLCQILPGTFQKGLMNELLICSHMHDNSLYDYLPPPPCIQLLSIFRAWEEVIFLMVQQALHIIHDLVFHENNTWKLMVHEISSNLRGC